MNGKKFMKKGIAVLKRVMSAVLVAVMLFTMVGIYIPAETFKAASYYVTGNMANVLSGCSITQTWDNGGAKPNGGQMESLGSGWYYKLVTFNATTAANTSVEVKVTDGNWNDNAVGCGGKGQDKGNIIVSIPKGVTQFEVYSNGTYAYCVVGEGTATTTTGSGKNLAVVGNFNGKNTSGSNINGDWNLSEYATHLVNGWYYKVVTFNEAFSSNTTGVEYKLTFDGKWDNAVPASGNTSMGTVPAGTKQLVFLVDSNSKAVLNNIDHKTVFDEIVKKLGSVSLDTSALYLLEGETGTIAATTTPAGIGLTYESEDTSIATVGANGVVTAVTAGETYIKVKITDDKYERCHVVVTAQAVPEEITLDKTTLDLTEDDTATLTPTVSPEGIAVTWTSDNPSVATVDHGVVTAVGGGTAIITATTPNGTSATCTVTVTEKPTYTYTIYVYSPDSSHMTTSGTALWFWDLETPKDFADKDVTFTTKETLSDGNSWLKATVSTKSKHVGMIFKKDGWSWQTVNIEYTNTASTDQTLYIVESTEKEGEKFKAKLTTSLPTLPASKSPVIEGNKVTFYYNNDTATSVYLAGDFNGWNGSEIKMNKKDGVFSYTKEFAPGVYQYKFVIGSSWIIDPLNTNIVTEASGNQNSKLIVKGFTGAAQEVQKGVNTELPATLDYIDASGNTKKGISVSYALSQEDIDAGVTITGNVLFVPEGYTAKNLELTVSGTVNGSTVTSNFDVSLYTKKYTYTIYARSAIASRNSLTGASLHIWDKAKETILAPGTYNFTGTEVLADGNTWLKYEIELTASKEIGFILKNYGTEWNGWQTTDLIFSNTAKTDQTLYIVDGYSTIYTDINKVPTEKYVYIVYENKDGNYANTYAYAWNNGFTQKNAEGKDEGLNFPFESVNGQYIAKIPVVAGDADKTIGFIVKKGTGWDAKEGGDNFIKIDADARFAKLRFENGMTTHVLSSMEGVKIDRKKDKITFYFRDKDLFEANNLAALDGKVSLYVIAETAGVAGTPSTIPMTYDEINERFYCEIDLTEDTDYYYYYIVDGEKVLDAVNEKTAGFENETFSLVRNKVYKVKLTATLRNPSMNHDQNNVIYLTWAPETPEDSLYGFKPEKIYVDLSQLGLSSKAEMNLELLAFAFGCADDTEAGTKVITVTLVDDCDMSYSTTVEINIEKRNKADGVADTETQLGKFGEFDWDEAVIYFAVTDRFVNGNTSNDTATEGYDPNGPSSIHGGDFAGLTEKIDYLYQLGVNTIWITPIVDNIDNALPTDDPNVPSYGYHGYWASDFETLNPHLGTQDELKALIDAAHERGMKIMVDVVLNHAGYDAQDEFDDIIPVEGAVDGDGYQVYKDMFRDPSVNIDEEKMSINGLPDFLTEDPEVRAQLIEWQTQWLSLGIDYYRVDTVKHVDDTTWEAFKIALTEKDPDFKLIGEYFDAGYRNDFDQLDSGKMDSVLDFHFNDIMVALTTQDFAAIESALQMRNVLLTNTATMGSFLSSHDENGFLFDLRNKYGVDYDWAYSLMKVAASYQITAKGQPVIYYGEELGMTGENNYPYQTNRYDWNESLVDEGNSMYTHYRTMLNIRRQYSEVFAKGERYSVVLPNVQEENGNVISQGYEVFARSYKDETVYVGTNLWKDSILATFYVNGGEGSIYTDLYSGVTYTVGKDGYIVVGIPGADQGGTVVLVKTQDGTAIPTEDTNKVTVKIHYNRPNGDYAGWNAWLWSDTTGGAQYDFVEDASGEMVATITVDGRMTNNVNFRIRFGDWKDNDHNAKDQSINISDVVSGTVHYYVEQGKWGGIKVLGGDAVVGNKVVKSEYDRNTNTFKIQTTRPVAGNIYTAFKLFCVTEGEYLTILNVVEDGCTYTISVEEDLTSMRELFKSYIAEFEGYKYNLVMPNIYSTKEFEDAYTYDGDDLGLTYTSSKSTFKVWAPTADKVVLNVYRTGTAGTDDLIGSYEMELGTKGVYSYELEGDHNGEYYTYSVTVNNATNEVCDPYARTTGVNGQRAMILDLDSTDPEDWDKDVTPHEGMSYTDAVIYELHVRDLSSHASSGITNKGKFLGLTETGTNTKADGTGSITGLDHIIDLGVTHVHLLPVYDYATVDETKLDETKYDPQFNWGYDPMNYNVPEGSYSTDPYNGEYRVNEMKQMVQALHANNINVIMDVVYNHVFDAGKFGFNQIVPSYFSRTNADGSYSNGSGCGNDTASERAMVHKYIVESILYWHEEYHIDGFRFDLVGLLDTQTINAIVDSVHEIDPDIVFYGEGWELGTAVSKDGYSLATMFNSNLTPGFAYFNDQIRNGIAGSDTNGQGFIWVSGKEALMNECFTASNGWNKLKSPTQTINYASCHDNYTLMDKINVVSGANYNSYDKNPGSYQVKLNNLTAAFYMLAEGIPLIHAGEEFLRVKLDENGTVIHNSYNASDYVNTLRWYNLDGNALYADTVEYYKGLIEFRKNHAALRLTTNAQVNSVVTSYTLGSQLVGYKLDGTKVADEVADSIIIIYNGTGEDKYVDIKGSMGAANGTWKVCIDADNAGKESLYTVNVASTYDWPKVAAHSALVLVKGETEDTDSVYTRNNNVTISLDKSATGLQVGGTDSLVATVNPANSTLIWTSSNENVATVDKNGNVTAVAPGTATITVSTLHDVTTTCVVVVSESVSESITLDEAELTVKEGQTGKLVATVTPLGAGYTWLTSDASIATVDQGGNVTAVSAGTATITVRTENGATATCIVTVTHDLIKEEGKDSDCNTEGLHEHYKCAVCGKLFWDEDAQGEVQPEEVVRPKIPHALVCFEGEEAGCHKPGSKTYYECCLCLTLFLDEDGTQEVTRDELIIPAENTLIYMEEKNPTCTEDGYEAHYKCSGCGDIFLDEDADYEITDEDVRIPAEHVLEEVVEKAPSCTEAGNILHYVCDNCDKVFLDAAGTQETTLAEVTLAAGHKLTKVEAEAPTCTAAGHKEHYTCDNCDKVFLDAAGTQETTLAAVALAAGHKLTKVEAKAPTTSETGNKEHYVCSACGKLFLDAEGKNETTLKDVTLDKLQPEDPEEDVVYVPEDKIDEQIGNEADKLIEKLENEDDLKDVVSDETLEKVKDAIENNEQIVTELVIENKDDADVDDSAKELVKDALKNFADDVKSSIAQYLDIKVVLKKEQSNEELGTLNKLSEEVVLTFAIPEEWIKEGRIFKVIRVHNGKTDILPVTDNGDGTVSFKTDCFSTYALVYADTVADDDGSETPEEPTPTPPETGDKNMANGYLLVLLAGFAMAIAGAKGVKRKNVK